MSYVNLPADRPDAELSVPGTRGVLSTTVIEPAARLCQNCQTPMNGPFCYQCGQHERSSVRHAGLLLRDILHDVLNLDSRAIRTLKPLLLKPGYLTLEYFAGRRQRYVPPLRLYVIASLVFFLIAGLLFSLSDDLQFEGDDQAAEEALNEPEVRAALADPELAEALQKNAPAMREAMLRRGLIDANGKPIPAPPTVVGDAIPTTPLEHADARQQNATEPAPASAEAALSAPAPPEPDQSSAEPPVTRIDLPTNLGFLPAFANQWLSDLKTDLNEKAKRIKDDPKKLIAAVLSVLPQSMFILLPLFALLLKLFYPFANRLYMEHLIVALHSHCFLYLLFTLLIVGNHLLIEVLGLDLLAPWLVAITGTITGLLLAFGVPLYLYLMQKRVYGQGHLLTFSKFVMIGVLYLTLLAVVIAIDIMVGIMQL